MPSMEDRNSCTSPPLVSIMSLVNRPYYRLWVQPEITRLEELRGKLLGLRGYLALAAGDGPQAAKLGREAITLQRAALSGIG